MLLPHRPRSLIHHPKRRLLSALDGSYGRKRDCKRRGGGESGHRKMRPRSSKSLKYQLCWPMRSGSWFDTNRRPLPLLVRRSQSGGRLLPTVRPLHPLDRCCTHNDGRLDLAGGSFLDSFLILQGNPAPTENPCHSTSRNNGNSTRTSVKTTTSYSSNAKAATASVETATQS